MAHITFYEKPGCGGNAKQKALLRAARHTLDVRDLLSWPWNADALLAFLAPLPVAEWFNPAAPRIKSGDINPAALDADAAMALLLAEPLLIRRPLMALGEERLVGFNADKVHAWVGLGPNAPASGTPLEGCAAATGSCSSTASTPS
jgi:nitrogenase-associated protein